jgi:hypothetical protein
MAIANYVPESVRRAFDVAGVEWGRADYAKFRGRDIVYEINTAPYPRLTEPYGNTIRIETTRIIFARMYALLREIDWGDGTSIRYRQGKPWQRFVESQRIRDLLKPIWRRLPESQRRRLETWILSQNK